MWSVPIHRFIWHRRSSSWNYYYYQVFLVSECLEQKTQFRSLNSTSHRDVKHRSYGCHRASVKQLFVEIAFSSGNEMWSIWPMMNSYFIMLLNYVQRQPMAFRVLDCHQQQQQQLIEQRDFFRAAKRRNENRKA